MKKIAITMTVAAVYLFSALTASATPVPRPNTLSARGVSQNPVTGQIEPGFAQDETQGTNIHRRSFDIKRLVPRRHPSNSDNNNAGYHAGSVPEQPGSSSSSEDEEPANPNLSQSAILTNWSPCSLEHLFPSPRALNQAASAHLTGNNRENPFSGYNEDQLKEKLTELIRLHSNPALNNNQRHGNGRGRVNIQPDSDTSDDLGWNVEYYLFKVYEELMPKLWLNPAQYADGKQLKKDLVEVAMLLSLVTDPASRSYPVRLVEVARRVLPVMQNPNSPRAPSPNRSRQASSPDRARFSSPDHSRPSSPGH